jgi:hypothetical protein
VPLVKHFIPDSNLLVFGKTLDRLESRRVLGNESPFHQQRRHLSELVLLGKVLDIDSQLFWRDMGQRILDSMMEKISTTNEKLPHAKATGHPRLEQVPKRTTAVEENGRRRLTLPRYWHAD